MHEGIQQLALVSSILGGFSITYVCAILTMNTGKKVEFWIFILGLIASMSFLLATLGWSLVEPTEKVAEFRDHHQFLVKFLLLGLVTIISSISLSGWLKNRKTGIATTLIGIFSLLILFTQILSRYIHL